MPQIPTQARRPRQPSELTQFKMQDALLQHVRPPRLGRPPRDDEEKRSVLVSLCALKSAGKTNKECAAELDVSERTIANYLSEPLYQEVQNDLVDQAKERGYATLSMLMDEALATHYQLMRGASSEFVRFKAAESILNYLGFSEQRVRAHTDSRDEVARFLSILEERQQRVQVNVQVNTTAEQKKEGEVVTVEQAIPAELQPYYQQVLPGGRLPSSEPAS